MIIRAACEISLPRRDLGRPNCPACGSLLLIAEESEFSVDGGHIRHAWSCDDCGHDFVTSIALRPR
jgi:RNase P subunit RPR2